MDEKNYNVTKTLTIKYIKLVLIMLEGTGCQLIAPFLYFNVQYIYVQTLFLVLFFVNHFKFQTINFWQSYLT